MKTFLIIDYWVQTILFGFMFVSIPLIFIPMLLLAILGGWQLFSGFITGLFFKKLDRKFYTFKALGYLSMLGGAQLLSEGNLLPEIFNNGLSFILFYLVVPIIIGVWYYKMVDKDYKKFGYPKTVENNKTMMNSPMVVS